MTELGSMIWVAQLNDLKPTGVIRESAGKLLHHLGHTRTLQVPE